MIDRSARGTTTTERPPEEPLEAPSELRTRVTPPPTQVATNPNDPGQMFQAHIVIGTTTGNLIAPQRLGFRGRCVIVDNFTNQYIYIPGANTWATPYVTGQRLLFGAGTDHAETGIGTHPRGIAQAATVAGEICVLTWCENVIPSSPMRVSIATP